jgi:hypothetical protein
MSFFAEKLHWYKPESSPEIEKGYTLQLRQLCNCYLEPLNFIGRDIVIYLVFSSNSKFYYRIFV